MATGTGFADALSGGPYAASLGAPLYLSTPTCVPEKVLHGMIGNDVIEAILLGSTGALSANVANMVTC